MKPLFKKYFKKYGKQAFTEWLVTYDGIKEIKNPEIYHYENGKMMIEIKDKTTNKNI